MSSLRGLFGRVVVMVVAVAVSANSCLGDDLGDFGQVEGFNPSLVVAIEEARTEVLDVVGDAFDEFDARGGRVEVLECSLFDMYEADFVMVVEVDGLTPEETYLELKRNVPNAQTGRNATTGFEFVVFDMALVAGRGWVEQSGNGVEVGAGTGCFAEDAWGVADPMSLAGPYP